MDKTINISDLQKYYSSVYYSLRRNGLKNKLLLILMLIPAVLYAYYDVNERYKYFEWDYPHEYLYYLCGLLFVVLLLFIVTINTISFVNSQRVRVINNRFKNELFECIRQQIPEINRYCHFKKIHPACFHESGLYKSAHTDYIGDDLFHGEYAGSRFEICEVHVFKLFKQVFNGLFIRIQVHSTCTFTSETESFLMSSLQSVPDGNQTKIKINNNGMIYMTVRLPGRLFEQTNLKEIGELQDEIVVLSDTVKIIREIIIACNDKCR